MIKKLLFLMLIAVTFTACKTSEANYKAAYDKAKERTRENMGAEVYEKYQSERVRSTEVVNGDSVRVITEYFNIVDGNAADTKKYSVVVAEFDQIINARSYRDRLKAKEGFESYVVYTNKNKKYLVVVQGYDEKGQAAAFIKNISQYMKMKVLVPRPYILKRI